MRLLEFEAKNVLRQYEIPVPAGELVTSADSFAIDAPSVLKAQIPIGGRDKAGGIHVVETTEEAKAKALELLFATVHGFKVEKLLLEEKVDIAQEFYLGLIYDTVEKKPVAIFSSEGGIDIEEMAAGQPGKVRREHFSVRTGFLPFQARAILSEVGISGRVLLELGRIFSQLGSLFLECDATIAEINPLAMTSSGELVAVDCHLAIDDDALFRQNALTRDLGVARRSDGEGTTTDFERRAAQIDMLDHRGVAGRVVEFGGTLGLIIGGGGGSLTAFDAIQAHGGKPANYCEIGGNPSVRKVKELAKLIISKQNVERIAVIMNVVSNTRADLVARGVVKGILEAGKTPSEVISLFRVPGAWEEEASRILCSYGVFHCDRRTSIDEAARIAVQRATGIATQG